MCVNYTNIVTSDWRTSGGRMNCSYACGPCNHNVVTNPLTNTTLIVPLPESV